MTRKQQKDLMIEWGLYDPRQQDAIVKDYMAKYPDNYSQSEFLEYLADALEIRGYWAKIGLT